MTSSSSSSRAATLVPPPSICRCCLAEGCDKDMTSPYQCDGVEEVYGDMLKETFDVEFLLPVGDDSATKHICDDCIVQLRQAFQFKHLTIRSAMRFQQYVDKLNTTRGGNTKKQKEEEVNVSEDHNTDNMSECFSIEALDEDFLSDDYEPTKTQPENKCSTRMKRKMSMETEYDLKKAKVEESGDIIKVEPRNKLRGDILSQLESNLWSQGTNISVKPLEPKDKPSERKNNETNKAKLPVPRGDLSFTKKGEQNNAAKKTVKTHVKREKSIGASETDPADLTVAEDNMIPDNILMLLEWSNICLFHYKTTTRSREKEKFKCYFCTERFANLTCLRAHTESHDKADMVIKLLRSNINCVILVEISYLKCKCGVRCEKLSDLMNHLTDAHKVPFEDKTLDNLEAYKVAQNGLVCDLCEIDAFEKFGRLRRHVRDIHIKHSIDMCEECGKVFKGAHTAKQMKEHKKLDHAAGFASKKKRTLYKKNTYLDNLITLVSNSNACPFHWPTTEKTKPFKCYCCHLHYDEIKELRHHFTSKHDMAIFRSEMSQQQIRKTALKLEITDLKCRNCEEPCDDLDMLRLHLSESHDIASYEEKTVITLKIEGEGYKCLVCQDVFKGWVPLNRHLRVSGCVSISSNKFECADCARKFVGRKTWQAHMKNLHSGDKNKISDICALRANTKTLLEHSNMTIFIFDDVRFRCFSCHETFVHFHELMAHSDTHDTQSVVSIMKLAKNTKSTHSYFNIKADITDLKCNVCQNAFEQIDEFQKHLVESHQVKLFKDGSHHLMPYMVRDGLKCACCKQSFRTSQTLVRHVNSHAAGSSEVCDQCGKSFLNANLLRRHKKRTHGEIKCAVCNITFRNQKAKQTHNKNYHNHSGGKPKRRFLCGFCKNVFSSAESKYRHMKEEHGYQTPEHNCDLCDKVFCTKVAYEIHIAKHRKIKMVSCKHCLNSILPENLEAHIQHSHRDALTLRCYVCRSKFASPDLLCNHLADSHSDDASYCPLCEYLPKDIESLLSHLRISHKLDNMLDVEWTAVKRQTKGRASVSRRRNVERHDAAGADEAHLACVQIEELL